MTAPTEIIAFEPRYAADFKRLNLEWLERHFRVEPIDVQVLSLPQDLLDSGGVIWLARQGDEIIGCCALIAKGDGAYELSKMAVTAAARGRGVGRRLRDANGAQFRQHRRPTAVPRDQLGIEDSDRALRALGLRAPPSSDAIALRAR